MSFTSSNKVPHYLTSYFMEATARSLFLAAFDTASSVSSSPFLGESLFDETGFNREDVTVTGRVVPLDLPFEPQVTLLGLLEWTSVLLVLYVLRMFSGVFLAKACENSHWSRSMLILSDSACLMVALCTWLGTNLELIEFKLSVVLSSRAVYSVVAGATDVCHYINYINLPKKQQGLFREVASAACFAGAAVGLALPTTLYLQPEYWRVTLAAQGVFGFLSLCRRAVSNCRATKQISPSEEDQDSSPSPESIKEKRLAEWSVYLESSKRRLFSSLRTLLRQHSALFAIGLLLTAAWVAVSLNSWIVFLSILQILTFVFATCGTVPMSSCLDSSPTALLLKWWRLQGKDPDTNSNMIVSTHEGGELGMMTRRSEGSHGHGHGHGQEFPNDEPYDCDNSDVNVNANVIGSALRVQLSELHAHVMLLDQHVAALSTNTSGNSNGKGNRSIHLRNRPRSVTKSKSSRGHIHKQGVGKAGAGVGHRRMLSHSSQGSFGSGSSGLAGFGLDLTTHTQSSGTCYTPSPAPAPEPEPAPAQTNRRSLSARTAAVDKAATATGTEKSCAAGSILPVANITSDSLEQFGQSFPPTPVPNQAPNQPQLQSQLQPQPQPQQQQQQQQPLCMAEVAAVDSDLRLVETIRQGIEPETQLDLSVSVSNAVQSAAAGAVGGLTAFWGVTWHWQSPLHEAQSQTQSQSQSETLEIADAQEEKDNMDTTTDWTQFSILTEDKD